MSKTVIFFGLFAGVLLDMIGTKPRLVGQTVSGFPGDDIPDIYYFATDGSVNTSLGVIDRPAGTLTVDTDGTDMVAVIVSGADVSLPPACDLCDGFNLPDPKPPSPDLSTWTVGFFNETTLWIRTNPLDAEGFVGVVGEHEKISVRLLPEFGLANYGPGLGQEDFSEIIEGPTGTGLFGVVYATNMSGLFFTNVTIVPEPHGLLLLLMVAPAVGIVRAHVARET